MNFAPSGGGKEELCRGAASEGQKFGSLAFALQRISVKFIIYIYLFLIYSVHRGWVLAVGRAAPWTFAPSGNNPGAATAGSVINVSECFASFIEFDTGPKLTHHSLLMPRLGGSYYGTQTSTALRQHAEGLQDIASVRREQLQRRPNGMRTLSERAPGL